MLETLRQRANVRGSILRGSVERDVSEQLSPEKVEGHGANHRSPEKCRRGRSPLTRHTNRNHLQIFKCDTHATRTSNPDVSCQI